MKTKSLILLCLILTTLLFVQANAYIGELQEQDETFFQFFHSCHELFDFFLHFSDIFFLFGWEREVRIEPGFGDGGYVFFFFYVFVFASMFLISTSIFFVSAVVFAMSVSVFLLSFSRLTLLSMFSMLSNAGFINGAIAVAVVADGVVACAPGVLLVPPIPPCPYISPTLNPASLSCCTLA